MKMTLMFEYVPSASDPIITVVFRGNSITWPEKQVS